MAIKLNDPVQIKHTPLTGTVQGAQVDQATLEMQYLVAYDDNDGEPQQRYFTAEQLQPA